MKFMQRLLISSIFTGLASAAMAAPVVVPSAIAQIPYDATASYQITGFFNKHIFLMFEKGECIKDLWFDAEKQWETDEIWVGTCSNKLALRPTGAKLGTQNLTIVTDRRHYPITLSAREAREGDTFWMQFAYSRSKSWFAHGAAAAQPQVMGEAPATPAVREADTPAVPELLPMNCSYSVSGTRAIKLMKACDNGRVTYLEFAPNSRRPAIFAVDSKGNEETVNFHEEGPYLVVERVTAQMTLRDGELALCLFNEGGKADEDNTVDVRKKLGR